jgi:ergothioneine biosynthesis protein EgtB
MNARTRSSSFSSSGIAGPTLVERYREVRGRTEALCRPLAAEDYVVQSMTEASPAKWHLAHTSWFFETFVLEQGEKDFHPFHPLFRYLFNSYYNAVGPMHERPRRGLLTRPTVKEVYAYREHVDRRLTEFLEHGHPERVAELHPVIVVGLHHEQQHQELLLTDLKHLLSMNPLHPVYREHGAPGTGPAPAVDWLAYDEGLREIGFAGKAFAYDNETPRHREFVPAFRLADRLVTAGEYLEFMADGGYERPDLWLSDGWATVQEEGWRAPLYWERLEGEWHQFTLGGLRPVRPEEPVCHVSHYEADAYARWAEARLPSEAEWETAAEGAPILGNFVESDRLHPAPLGDRDAVAAQTDPGPADPRDRPAARVPAQLFGDVWEWTQSPYSPYPGYRPPAGALGEYNGKFMINQMVLRGGSCFTPVSHIRPTYRNFFHPRARWQASGIRLAQDA